MVIILKYIEIASHYFVYQDLMGVLQVNYTSKSKKQTKLIEKKVRFVATINGSREVELDEGSLKL